MPGREKVTAGSAARSWHVEARAAHRLLLPLPKAGQTVGVLPFRAALRSAVGAQRDSKEVIPRMYRVATVDRTSG